MIVELHGGYSRQAHGEGTSHSSSIARCLNQSAVELYQPPHEGEPNAKPAL